MLFQKLYPSSFATNLHVNSQNCYPLLCSAKWVKILLRSILLSFKIPSFLLSLHMLPVAVALFLQFPRALLHTTPARGDVRDWERKLSLTPAQPLPPPQHGIPRTGYLGHAHAGCHARSYPGGNERGPAILDSPSPPGVFGGGPASHSVIYFLIE